jgi:hypothetical protein
MGRTPIALTVLAALALSACGTEQPADDAGATPTPSASPSTASPEPSPSPESPSEPALPEAMDGTDLDACYDGSCEVEVRAPLEIEFDPDIGIASMTIEQITAEGLELSGTTTSGGSFSSGLYAAEGGLAKGVFNHNGVTFELAVLGVHDGVAVLRIERL